MGQFISIIVFLLCAGVATAQTSPSLRLGVFGTYGGAQTDQSIFTQPCLSCPDFNALSGTIVNGGIVLQLPFTSGDGINVGLLAQVGYHYASLKETVPGDDLPSLDQDGNVVYSSTEYRADISDELLLLDLAIDLVMSGITLNAGMSAGYRVDVKGQLLYALTSPPGAKFDPFLIGDEGVLIDSSTIEIGRWDDETVDAIVIGPYASLGYRFVVDDLSIDVAAESRLLWNAAIPDATQPMWTYGGILRVMYGL
ncbi:MAG: hypothetical protein EHM43_04585 [Ignavibacteriae bacterium]|nr:MAG: hypothetical protein EHM43_04585 [Ignavibacteriota bacterium]